MAVKQVQTSEGINPQIIPMIDIMFLLLLFFMLGADMGQRELEEVKLPVADGVKEDKGDSMGDKRPLTVNCYHVYETEATCPAYAAGNVCVNDAHWRIGIKGVDYSPDKLKDVLEKEAALERHDTTNLLISERLVQIRADASALYGHVQKVMNTCAEVGIYKVEIGAAAKVENK
ncbi:MAG TPA: biopolymer transporter ExbD [Planctomycetota bacterium]|nr:biopolymer transporter ExbD [Planctomycetota bacterium]